jgi:hypothetical protein
LRQHSIANREDLTSRENAIALERMQSRVHMFEIAPGGSSKALHPLAAKCIALLAGLLCEVIGTG